MQIEPIEVVSKQGVKHEAMCLKCECGNASFIVWTAKGLDHPHLQCPLCNATHCQRDPKTGVTTCKFTLEAAENN